MSHESVVYPIIFLGHGFCCAEHADFTDIQKTGLIGSLEIMGTREVKNKLAYFSTSGLPILPKAQPWESRYAGFPAVFTSYPVYPVNPV
jgi:hypothetical protein